MTRSEIKLNKELKDLEAAFEKKIKQMRRDLNIKRNKMIAKWEGK